MLHAEALEDLQRAVVEHDRHADRDLALAGAQDRDQVGFETESSSRQIEAGLHRCVGIVFADDLLVHAVVALA